MTQILTAILCVALGYVIGWIDSERCLRREVRKRERRFPRKVETDEA